MTIVLVAPYLFHLHQEPKPSRNQSPRHHYYYAPVRDRLLVPSLVYQIRLQQTTNLNKIVCTA